MTEFILNLIYCNYKMLTWKCPNHKIFSVKQTTGEDFNSFLLSPPPSTLNPLECNILQSAWFFICPLLIIIWKFLPDKPQLPSTEDLSVALNLLFCLIPSKHASLHIVSRIPGTSVDTYLGCWLLKGPAISLSFSASTDRNVLLFDPP